jgi:hypothetical protein
MSLSASKKASSLVVATSMAAVEALKDQAGLCRWDYALRSLYQRGRRAVPVSLSSSQAASSGTADAAIARGARPRRSEEEKLHKAYHIVCWGPN